MAANPTLTQPSPPAPFLEFQHVSISFGSSHVLNDVSFTVLPGERVCILGRSGVGKSVCLRIMMGFLKPDAGRVITAGEDITNYSEEELQRIRKKVTMVFQNGGLFDSLTVEENVAFPLRERENLDEEPLGDPLPKAETWTRYLRDARAAYGRSKHQPLAGRETETGHSVVRSDQI